MAEPLQLQVDAQKALLAALLDQSHECIKLLDHEGRILFVNREGCSAMELSAPEDLLGRRWVERWPHESLPVVESALRTARSGDVARFSATRAGPAGEPRWWDVSVTPIAAGGDARYVTIARDVTAEVTEKERVAAVSAEMRHRLKNAMAIAAGIVTLEARSAPQHQAFARMVSERLGQLARVQELVLDPSQDKTLAQVVPMLASVYGGSTLLKIGKLPAARLGDTATQALALTFGELATNSLKYGALRAARPVEIEAAVEDGLLHVLWSEPTDFGAPREGGQGMSLIDRLLGAAGGHMSCAVEPGWFIARVSLPVRT